MLKNEKKLFENSDDDEDYNLKTNTGYAKHYDEFRKKEILSHRKFLIRETIENRKFLMLF